MATITITEQVHVDIRIDDQEHTADYAAGTIDVPQGVADLLIAQGLATITVETPAPAPAKSSKKASSDPGADSTAPTTPSEA